MSSLATSRNSGGSRSTSLARNGRLAQFKEKLTDAGMKRFGSGWAWLVKTADGKLDIYSTANQDSPFEERWGGWYVTGTVGDLTGAISGSQCQFKTVWDIFHAIFDGNTGHNFLLLSVMV